MRRREFVGFAVAGVVLWPLAAPAQPAKRPKLGVLLVGNREQFSREFGEGLRELGYIDGQNITIELRSAEGKLDRLPELVVELVGLGVDIIIASETPAVHAAKRATGDIPIVMAPSGDPVGTGLIASLARPGGNVTGLSAATAELAGKSLELVRELLPSANRVAALADPTNAFTKPFLEQIHLFARALGIEIQDTMVRGTDEFASAFDEMNPKTGRGRDRAADIAAPACDSSDAATQASGGVGQQGVCRWRRADVIRGKSRRPVRQCGALCGQAAQGRQTGRPAGPAACEIRAGHQHENGKRARPDCAAIAARPRRRADRVSNRRTGPLIRQPLRAG